MQTGMSLQAVGQVVLNAAGLPVIRNTRLVNIDVDKRGNVVYPRPRAAGWQYAPKEYDHTRWQASAFGYYRRKPKPDSEITYGDGPACILPDYRDKAQAYREQRQATVKARKTAKTKPDLRPQHAKGLPCVCRECKTTLRATGTVEHSVKDHL